MSLLDLVFDSTPYAVPTASISDLMNHRHLRGARTYTVQSSVPRDVFETFVNSLKSQTKIPVTKENAAFLFLLANEFFLSDLASFCATFPVSLEQFSVLSERVSQLERQTSSFGNPLRTFKDAVQSHDRRLELLRLELENLKKSVRESRNPSPAEANHSLYPPPPEAVDSPARPPRRGTSPVQAASGAQVGSRDMSRVAVAQQPYVAPTAYPAPLVGRQITVPSGPFARGVPPSRSPTFADSYFDRPPAPGGYRAPPPYDDRVGPPGARPDHPVPYEGARPEAYSQARRPYAGGSYPPYGGVAPYYPPPDG
jgi:hypothetical protein